MKIVLLGASGQLGREWQTYLNDQPDGELILLPYTSSQLDITHEGELAHELQAQEPDVIINCAAYTDVDGAEEHRAAARKVNAGAVASLADLSTDLDYKLVHYSTDYVFAGRLEDREQFPKGYAEDHTADPVNYYGQTKWEGEQAVRKLSKDHLIIRVSWLCGAFGSNFVKTMLKLGRERDRLQVVNDQWGSPTFTENVVYNTWQLLEAEQNGTFHITSEGLITWYDFAKTIFDTAGLDVTIEAVSSDQFPTKADRPKFSKLNTQKVESVAGSQIIEWKSGLKAMLRKL